MVAGVGLARHHGGSWRHRKQKKSDLMSGIGTWQPAEKITVSNEQLANYVALAQSLDLNQLDQAMPAEQRETGASLMKLEASAWSAAAELGDEELEALIRFFTLAEMQLPGWDAGKTSPVIYLVKILKKRGAFTAELKQWIKQNTDNRFLPNGAIVL